jgi:nucleoside-diphosphate-sugar epimerase
MKVFLVGAGGFIGRNLGTLLESSGHSVIRHVWEKEGDLTEEAVPREAEIFVNASGMLGSPSARAADLRRANVEPAGILARASSLSGSPLIHLSTPGVTGLLASATESMPPAPWGAYEISKAEAESLLLSGMRTGLLTILRPDFVYGPGDRHKLAFFRQISKGWFPLIGTGSARIRPTFVLDAAKAVLAAFPGGPLAGGVFNVGGPEIVTVRRLAELSAEAMGIGIRLLLVPRPILTAAMLLGPLRPGALSGSRLALFGQDHFVDTAKASGAGFEALTPLREGLRMTVGAYRSEGLLP